MLRFTNLDVNLYSRARALRVIESVPHDILSMEVQRTYFVLLNTDR